MSKEKKNKLGEKLNQLEEQLKRALADYDNLKKRSEEEKKTVVKFASALIIVKFLEILDNLEAAQKNLNDSGLELVIKKFKELLVSENIREIQAEGEIFDPNLHEAVAVIDGERNDEVVEVVQKGYQLDEKVLRPVRVKVTKSNPKVGSAK